MCTCLSHRWSPFFLGLWFLLTTESVDAQDKRACATKADTIFICKDTLCRGHGVHNFRMTKDFGMVYEGGGPTTVYYWRAFAPSEANVASSVSVVPGGVYASKDGERFTHLCDVDPSLIDEQIAAKLGITSEVGRVIRSPLVVIARRASEPGSSAPKAPTQAPKQKGTQTK